MADHPNLPKHNPNATVRSVNELIVLDSSVTEIIIDNGVSDLTFTELDLSRFTRLRKLEIGDYCLNYVTTVNITGLSELESVVIGKKSFMEADRFSLKYCPKMSTLSVGNNSFVPCSVIEIENVDALEIVEMGDSCFSPASLELKSILILNK